MTVAVRLECWGLTDAQGSNPFHAPEARPRALVGRVYGHPRKRDGERVITTRIVAVSGRQVTTASGTLYALGEVDPEYLAYVHGLGRALDEAEPIKLVRRP